MAVTWEMRVESIVCAFLKGFRRGRARAAPGRRRSRIPEPAWARAGVTRSDSGGRSPSARSGRVRRATGPAVRPPSGGSDGGSGRARPGHHGRLSISARKRHPATGRVLRWGAGGWARPVMAKFSIIYLMRVYCDRFDIQLERPAFGNGRYFRGMANDAQIVVKPSGARRRRPKTVAGTMQVI